MSTSTVPATCGDATAAQHRPQGTTGPAAPRPRASLALAVERVSDVDLPLDDEWCVHVATAAFAVGAGSGHRGRFEVVLLLADDATLLALNQRFRRMDRATDVLAFEGEGTEPHGGASRRRRAPRHLGDIAISVERARHQAAEYGHSFERELAYLLVHGMLHLLGDDHMAEVDRAAMRQREEAALDRLGLARQP